ncbi:hypothetical protein BMS3Abin17_00494 [archaeon BMS3Abin17]|nr:hypothetical protein BMS3Abin17_00494 [archaeon BMS3Abin17]HDZ61067.1 hypothetical protein [Candidatus Pacearchaeota archaeon]
MRKTIRLRDHHLESASLVHLYGRNGFANLLIEANYINSSEHPFLNVAYDAAKKLFSDPYRLLLIVDNERDFICRKCPIIRGCSSNGLSMVDIEPALSPFGSKDKQIAEKHGFRIGEIYASWYIREKMGFLGYVKLKGDEF